MEALVRVGVGALDLVDDDIFSPTNLNRQLYATREILEQAKADVAAAHVRLIDQSVQPSNRP